MIQKHTLAEVFLDRDFRVLSLCLQPTERTQFLNIQFSSGTIVDHV